MTEPQPFEVIDDSERAAHTGRKNRWLDISAALVAGATVRIPDMTVQLRNSLVASFAKAQPGYRLHTRKSAGGAVIAWAERK